MLDGQIELTSSACQPRSQALPSQKEGRDWERGCSACMVILCILLVYRPYSN
jgi:hypothetical protein